MSASIRRMISRRGRDWTYRRWVKDTTNEYGRTREYLEPGLTVRAIRTETAEETTTLTSRGEERKVDTQLIVMADAADFSDVRDTTKKAPRMIDPQGVEFEVLSLGLEGDIMGFRRLFLGKTRV